MCSTAKPFTLIILASSLGGLLLFASCGKQSTGVEPQRNMPAAQQAKATDLSIQYPDIPLPVSSKLVATTDDQSLHNEHYSYEAEGSREELLSFYVQSLEQEGWDIHNFSSQHQGVLVANKPQRSCVILVHSEKIWPRRATLDITVKEKQASESTGDSFADLSRRVIIDGSIDDKEFYTV